MALAEETLMKPRLLGIVLGIVVIAVLAFAGLAPLPGQKHKPSALGEKAPNGQSPEPAQPSGPPRTSPGESPAPAQ
jgi:hypothetical protein